MLADRPGIERVCFAAGGARLVAASCDRVEAFVSGSGACAWVLEGRALAGVLGSGALALVRGGERIDVVDPLHGRLLASLPGPGKAARACAALPDGRVLLALAGEVTVWNPRRVGAPPVVLDGCARLSSWTMGVRVSRDGGLAAAAGDRRVLVWDTASGARRLVLTGTGDGPPVFASDGRLATAGGDGGVLVWPLPELVGRPPEAAPSEDAVRRRAFRIWESRGRLAGGAEGDWYRAERELRAARAAKAIVAARFSADGRRIACQHEGEALRVWELAGGELLSVCTIVSWRPARFDPELRAFAVQRDEWSVGCGRLVDGEASAAAVRVFTAESKRDYRHEVEAVALAADAACVALAVRYAHVDSYVGDVFSRVSLWWPDSGAVRALPLALQGRVGSLRFSPAGDALLVNEDSAPRILAAATDDGRTLWAGTIPASSKRAWPHVVASAEWSPRGGAFAAAVDDDLGWIDIATGAVRALGRCERGALLHWSADGALLAVLGRAGAEVREVASGRSLRRWPLDGFPLCAWLRPGELRIACRQGPPFWPVLHRCTW
jgi:WD40 repeat protein